MSYERGQLVSIFQDPITCEKFEGYAILINEYGNTEHWNIQFIEDEAANVYQRKLSDPNNGHPQMIDADLFFMLTGETLDENR